MLTSEKRFTSANFRQYPSTKATANQKNFQPPLPAAVANGAKGMRRTATSSTKGRRLTEASPTAVFRIDFARMHSRRRHDIMARIAEHVHRFAQRRAVDQKLVNSMGSASGDPDRQNSVDKQLYPPVRVRGIGVLTGIRESLSRPPNS